MHAQIRYRTAERRIRVETVSPTYTSKKSYSKKDRSGGDSAEEGAV